MSNRLGFLKATDFSSKTSASSSTTIDQLPAEIHCKILKDLDPLDVLAFSRVCKLFYKYSDNQQLWKHHWLKLSRKTPFTFPPQSSLSELCINFKDACRRLWRILIVEGTFGGLNPTKCVYCRMYTCRPECVEDRNRAAKYTIDIGGKFTWVVTPSFLIERHISMIAVPKLLKCYDCDTTIQRNEYQCDCTPDPNALNPPSLQGFSARSQYCRSRVMSSHTALEYFSQPLSELIYQPLPSQPFCLFCDEAKLNRLLCEREMVSNTKNKMKGVRMPLMSMIGEEEFMNYNALAPMTNGYCRDTVTILGANNLDLLSPSLALQHEETLPIAKAYFAHLFQHFKMIDGMQRPNSSLILTVGKLPLSVSEGLIKFLFEDAKISRLCLLPKGVAIAQTFNLSACIVVDSGATTTSVYLVIDGKVDESKTQTMHIGGWHVSQFLKQAPPTRDNKELRNVTVSSLDTCDVKRRCRLSLNLAREAKSNQGLRGETILIQSQRESLRRLELTEVTLTSELYLAPEMMYKSLDLPTMVKEAAKDLPDHLVKDCFSNIILTGGNTNLQGFSQRFSSDLRELMPEHSLIINVYSSTNVNHWWETLMGATSKAVSKPYASVLEPLPPGGPVWITREEYILFGTHLLASNEPTEMEG